MGTGTEKGYTSQGKGLLWAKIQKKYLSWTNRKVVLDPRKY